MALFGADFPKGLCLLWVGDKKALPKGWLICDGQNGTVDLRFQASNLGVTAFIVRV